MKKSSAVLIIILLIITLIGAYVIVMKLKSDVPFTEEPSDVVTQTGNTPEVIWDVNDLKIDCEKAMAAKTLEELNPDMMSTGTMVFLNYYFNIKKDFTDPEFIEEIKRDHAITYELASKDSDCSSLLLQDKKDTYTYNLCKLYKAGDIQGIDSFKIESGDEDTILTLKSLLKGNYIEGAKKSGYDGVMQYEKFKTNIQFNLTTDPDESPIEYYIFFFNNKQSVFFTELDQQFLKECNKINNK